MRNAIQNQDELRSMVRELLREVLAGRHSSIAPARAVEGVEQVRISSDADLMAFAHRAIESQTAIRNGSLRFTLGQANAPAKSVSQAATSALPAVLEGVVTEHVVDRHAATGSLVLSPTAVITPLGRDRARKLNLKIERKR